MALSRGQKYIVLIAFGGFIALIALWQLLVIVAHVQAGPTVSESRDADQMVAGFSEVKPNATQGDVIAIMGSQFTVLKCPDNVDPNCAHIWHYESSGQAWDFMFDLDGNLMTKLLGTVGQ